MYIRTLDVMSTVCTYHKMHIFLKKMFQSIKEITTLKAVMQFKISQSVYPMKFVQKMFFTYTCIDIIIQYIDLFKKKHLFNCKMVGQRYIVSLCYRWLSLTFALIGDANILFFFLDKYSFKQINVA